MILQKTNPSILGLKAVCSEKRLFSESSKIKYIFLSLFSFTNGGSISLCRKQGINALKQIYKRRAAAPHLCSGLDCVV